VTIAIAPQLGETGEVKPLICPTTEAEYFSADRLTYIRGDLPAGQAQIRCASRMASRLQRLRHEDVAFHDAARGAS
jgi:hypothetical protein